MLEAPSDAEKKVAEFSQDLVKAEQKVDEQILRSLIDGTVQQLALHTVGGLLTPAQQLMVMCPPTAVLRWKRWFPIAISALSAPASR